MRRDLIHAAMALVLVPATVALVFWAMTKPPSVLAFPRPTHRVAVAVDEAMRGDLASVVRGKGSFATYWGLRKPDGKCPVMGEVRIPEDHPAFWLIPSGTSYPVPKLNQAISDTIAGRSYFSARRVNWPAPMLVTLDEIDFNGRDLGGRAVKVTVRVDTIGEGTIVDFHGDADLTRTLADRIANRLAHPEHRHESPEDREALMAFFGSQAPDRSDRPGNELKSSNLGSGPR